MLLIHYAFTIFWLWSLKSMQHKSIFLYVHSVLKWCLIEWEAAITQYRQCRLDRINFFAKVINRNKIARSCLFPRTCRCWKTATVLGSLSYLSAGCLYKEKDPNLNHVRTVFLIFSTGINSIQRMRTVKPRNTCQIHVCTYFGPYVFLPFFSTSPSH